MNFLYQYHTVTLSLIQSLLLSSETVSLSLSLLAMSSDSSLSNDSNPSKVFLKSLTLFWLTLSLSVSVSSCWRSGGPVTLGMLVALAHDVDTEAEKVAAAFAGDKSVQAQHGSVIFDVADWLPEWWQVSNFAIYTQVCQLFLLSVCPVTFGCLYI